MSMMLNFQNALWSLARASAADGRSQDALARLEPLCKGQSVPSRIQWMSHRLAARLHHNAERYSAARRHLGLALKLGLNEHLIRFEYGMAYEDDPYGCDRRAAWHFRQAVRLNPRNPKYRAVFGRALLRCGRLESGLKQLSLALRLDSNNIAVLKIVIDALNCLGRRRAAMRLTVRAIFLAPGDQELRRLWDETRFASARASQRDRKKSELCSPAVLPFVRVEREDGLISLIRHDLASRATPHITRLDFKRTRRV